MLGVRPFTEAGNAGLDEAKIKTVTLRLHDISKIYHHNITIALFYYYYFFIYRHTICVSIYLAKAMEPYCPRCPLHIKILAAKVSNKWLKAHVCERVEKKVSVTVEGKKCLYVLKCSLYK